MHQFCLYSSKSVSQRQTVFKAVLMQTISYHESDSIPENFGNLNLFQRFPKTGSCNGGLAREKPNIVLSAAREDSSLFAESSWVTRICTIPRITVLQGKSSSPEVSTGTKLFISLVNYFTSESFSLSHLRYHE